MIKICNEICGEKALWNEIIRRTKCNRQHKNENGNRISNMYFVSFLDMSITNLDNTDFPMV
jgi:hypothetical protein